MEPKSGCKISLFLIYLYSLISAILQLPVSLLQDLQQISGFDEQAFIAAHSQKPVTSVRINPAKDIGLFAGYKQVPWSRNGFYLPERPVFTLDPVYHAGAYYVQEASSMFLEHILRHIIQDRKGLRVLDLCAAPGGKSTLIAGLLDNESLLIANEVIRPRASILEENLTRWGYMNTWVTSNDPKDFSGLHGYFDVIVVDAPCSGSGLFRKDERAIEEWSEGNVALCGERQQRILANVWPALKENGTLVYATCSYSPREDEEILDWLVTNYDTTAIQVPLPQGWGIVPVTSDKGMAGYRFFPDKVQGEGFFIAAVQKNEETEEIYSSRFKTSGIRKINEQAGYLLQEPEMVFLQAGQDDYCAIQPAHEPDLQLLQKSIYFRKTGVRLGKPAAKEWLPDHEVALSIDANTQLPVIEVTREQGLLFLKREEMGITFTDRGWFMIRYNGLGLGWVKALGNRINNYLPKNWRIRMSLPDEDTGL